MATPRNPSHIQLDYCKIDSQVIDNALVNNVVNFLPKSHFGGHLAHVNSSLGKRGNR